MKAIIFWLFTALVPCVALSQTKVTKLYPVKNGQTIQFRFDYPKIIRISSWEKNEISVEATVNINDGKNNGAFSLEENTDDGKISISNKLDIAQIPNSYYIVENGIKTKFNSKEDLDNYQKDNSKRSGVSTYQTQDVQITIDIKVPTNVNTDIASVYGIVELKNFNGPIKIDAKYGGIDASLNEAKIGKIKLTNHYGKIYTNLSLKPTEQTEKNFFTSITASPGKGPDYDFSSNYGNIYLRNQIK